MYKRLLTLLLLVPTVLLAQHSIKGTFTPAKDFKFALLYKANPQVATYVNNAQINEKGEFEFKLDSTITAGVYKLVYAIPQEDYNFDIIYNGKEDIELEFNNETGVKYKSSTENIMLASYSASMYKITDKINAFYRKNNKKDATLKSLFKAQKETQEYYENTANGTIALNFIKAHRPYIPNSAEDLNTYTENIKKHYFDAVDFNNQTLQSSDFLTEHMFNYVYGANAEESQDDTAIYKENTKNFLSVVNRAPIKIKKRLLTDLWQQMADLNFESIANYITRNSLMDIAVKTNDNKLVEALTLYRNLSTGNKAPDFYLEVKQESDNLVETKQKLITKRLSDLDLAENYIIVFWSSTCSHCLEEIPQLHRLIETKEKGLVKVIAIGLEEEPYKWKGLTYNYPKFIHVYGEGKWDNKIGNDYNVTGTPTYFVLNKNKEIVFKPQGFEEVKSFFDVEKE